MKMALLSGAAMLALNRLGRKGAGVSLPSFKNILETVHLMPGRVRFRIPSLQGKNALAVQLAEQLDSLGAVDRAEANPVTGTVLIYYREDRVAPILVMGTVIRLLGLDKDLDAPRHGRLPLALTDGARTADLAIFEASRGLLDFNSAVALVLLGAAIRTVRANPARLTAPNPLTLAWWAFNRMVITGNR